MHSTSFTATKYFLKLLKFRKIINISILRNVLVDWPSSISYSKDNNNKKELAHMNKKTLISSLLITLAFLFLNVQKVSAAIDYNLFNYNYPVSAYYPKSSDKANVMGRIIKINNVRNDYSVSIPMDVSQNSEGKLNYFGLTTSTNAYFTHDSGNSITNAGSLTGPNTLVGLGLQNPVKLPIFPVAR